MQSRVSNLFMHVTDWLPTFYSAAGGNLFDLGQIDGVDQWSKLQKNEQGTRKFLLVNIDEKENTESGIFQKFKIVKGNRNKLIIIQNICQLTFSF